jgi:hypothetical protein
VEKEMFTLVGNPEGEDSKTLVVGKKPWLLTKTIEKETNDLEDVLNLVKKLSNEIVDLKKRITGKKHLTREHL